MDNKIPERRKDDECRISILEIMHSNFMTDFKDHCTREEIESKERREILEEVRDKQVKMTGFLAGITFAITVFTSISGFFLNKFFSGH